MPDPAVPPSQIQYDDFAKLELRVATVLDAQAHPNADKLLLIKVDLGAEQRQIVAGIRAYYEPEQLIGKQVVIVANLAPRTMRGFESQGMILAASTEDRSQVIVLSPERPITAGSRVS